MKRTSSTSCPPPSCGMSLVELMIAMAIGLFLLGGVVNVLINTKATYRVNEGISLLQQNARYLVNELNRYVRMAGYYGCVTATTYATDIASNASVHNTLKNASSDEYDFGNAIEVWEATGTGVGESYTLTATDPTTTTTLSNWRNVESANLPAMLSGLVIPGSDVLFIRGAGGDEIPLAKNNNAAQLFACTSATANGCGAGSTSYSGLCEQDIVVASDCTTAWIFQISNMQTTGQDTCTSGQMTNIVHSGTAMTPGNDETSWGGGSLDDDETLGSEATIMKISTTAYYVGRGTSGSPALYKLTANGTPNELVEGVENMQILLGEDTDNDGAANRYVPGNAATYANVVSLRVCLLMRTDQNVSTSTLSGSHMLCGTTAGTATTITPVADKRIRQTFTTTIKLRNRGSIL